LPTKGPFLATRELVRRVAADCTVEVDANAYSVPRRGLLASAASRLDRSSS